MIVTIDGSRAAVVELKEGGSMNMTEPTMRSVVFGLSCPELRFAQGATTAHLFATREEAAAFLREALALLEGGS